MSSTPTTLLGVIHLIPDGSIAVIAPEQNVRSTYGALRQNVTALAEQLAAAGVQRGARVAIALPNGLPIIVAFLAAAEVGTAAPLDPAYKEDNFRFYLEDTAAKFLILPPDAEEARRAATAQNVRVLPIEMDPSGVVSLASASERKPYARPTPADVALILHTNGSTGRPKRVPLTHTKVTISAMNVARHYRLTKDDVAMCVTPLFHVHGLVASALATLSTGGTLVVPANFNPLSFWRTARDTGMTWYSAVPAIHQLLLARGADPDRRPEGAAKLRFIRSSGAALPLAVMEALEKAFGAPVLEAYGITEAAHQVASNPLPPDRRRAGSVGRGTDVQIGIMDDSGSLMSPGQPGEVVIKGPNVIAGYENDPEADAKSFTNGWFHTGDRGVLDERGNLSLVGRIEQLINRGGEKISPREIVEVLLRHPAVSEAVAFGVPHATWGEEVAAAVVCRCDVGESELVAFCKANLADFKRPKQIHITTTTPHFELSYSPRDSGSGPYAHIRRDDSAGPR